MMKILFQKGLVLIVGMLFIGSCFMSFSAVVGEDTEGHDYYFIQFSEFTTASQREAISQSYNVDFLENHQDNKFLARIDSEMLRPVIALPNVKSVELYLPSQKIHNDLIGVTGVIKLRINLHQGVDVDVVAEQLETLCTEIIQVNTVSVNFIRCIIDSSLIDEISSINEVSWIQQEFEPQVLMNHIQTTTFMGQDLPQTFGYRGGGILTEVQDNGIDADIVAGAGNGHQDLMNVLYTDGGAIVNDHGTCVSGIMFGQGIGDPAAQGLQYEGVGAFAQWNTGNALTIANLWNGDFNEGPALMNGVVQTNSWWSGAAMTSQYNALTNEIDQAAVDYPRVQTHWACGNSNFGVGPSTMSCESVAKNDISGGAIFHKDTADMSDDDWHNNGAGSTPSQGPAADGRVKPDLCATFDWIYTCDEEPGGYVGGDYYSNFGGTSGATPTIAGSTGLTYDMYQDNYFGNNPFNFLPYSCTAKALMIADAQQYPLPNPNDIRRDVQGWGTPDLENMYDLGADYHVIEEYPQALSAGDTWNRSIYVDGTQKLKVSLVWIDPAAPSSTGTGRALINNLDLRVTSPLGVYYWGNNGLDNSTWSSAGTGVNRWSIPEYVSYRDDRNNVENVFIEFPMSGLWTIEVLGRFGDLPDGPQDFSIVASGAKSGQPPVADLDVPNGGEVWTVDTFHDITWTMSDAEDPPADLKVTLDYSINGGSTYPYNIITDVTGFGSSGVYNWQIPNTPTSNAKVRITVTDTFDMSTVDESDLPFTISVNLPVVQVISPNGGESLMGGGSWEVTWTAGPGTNPLAATPITIDYSIAGPGGPWTPLSTNELNDGTYIWDPVPTLDMSNCYVRVTAEDDAGFTGDDISDSNFNIDSTAPLPASNPMAELTAPNHVTISWTGSVSPDVGHYEVYYILNGWDPTGDSYNFLADPGMTTSHQHNNVGVNNPSSYCWQVRTFDVAGNEARTIIQAGKTSSTQSTFANPSGWFLLGSHLVQSDTSLAHVIQGAGLPANWDCVQMYDVATGDWHSNIVGRPDILDNLWDITNEQGFWLHITASTRFATAGHVEDMSINLKAGWNMVAYPFAEKTMTTANVMTHLSLNCPNYDGMKIADYTVPYRLKVPDGTETLAHGFGFWVKVSADTTWSVTNY